MPFETSCNDVEKRHIKLNPQSPGGGPGELDSPPVYTQVSGAGSFMADPDGMGVYLISEDNVVGNGPFDSVYEVKAMAGGVEIMDTLTLHVSNDEQTQPATNFGFVADAPEPK